MNIEIKGIHFPNKGAELMLVAVMQRLSATLGEENVSFVLDPRQAYSYRAPYGLLQKFRYSKFGVKWDYLGNFIPYSVRENYGLVTEREIDVILDASGFAYGDQWGAEKAEERAAKHVERWKKEGKKVILLPQAFGPFSSERLQSAMRTVLTHADLVYAREGQSYEYLRALKPDASSLRQAPDFTNLVKGVLPRSRELDGLKTCLIVNNKMLEMTGAEGERYVPLMTTLTRHLLEHDLAPFLLVHEGEKDLQLAQEVQRRVAQTTGQEVPLWQEDDPVAVKGIIGQCQGLISSRFHGLVSGLSQGVPSLGTGWSHKYQRLFEDYGCPENLIGLEGSDEAVFQQLTVLTDETKRRALAERTAAHAEAQKERSEKMWAEVVGTLQGRAQVSPAAVAEPAVSQ